LERRTTEGSGGTATKQEKLDDGNPAKVPRYNSMGVQQSPSDWATPYSANTPNAQHASKKMAMSSPTLNRPPVPSWGSLEPPSPASAKHTNTKTNTKPNTFIKQRNNSTTAPQPLPISLSLSEDERSPPNRSGSNDSTQSPRLTKSSMLLSSGTGLSATGQGSSSSGAAHNPLASPLDTDDMLYEYFPLSLDDWMPPVDAIYRPHVVHHTIVPPEVKAQQVRSKAKRYFAAE